MAYAEKQQSIDLFSAAVVLKQIIKSFPKSPEAEKASARLDFVRRRAAKLWHGCVESCATRATECDAACAAHHPTRICVAQVGICNERCSYSY